MKGKLQVSDFLPGFYICSQLYYTGSIIMVFIFSFRLLDSMLEPITSSAITQKWWCPNLRGYYKIYGALILPYWSFWVEFPLVQQISTRLTLMDALSLLMTASYAGYPGMYTFKYCKRGKFCNIKLSWIWYIQPWSLFLRGYGDNIS